ncbi:hypothetical protein BpHYR1_033132 [Brachionus plicatilis]|uniref:Uncharacterized protein n=1 Tax=Brachionus plicatilis TaxID=10195 RepID=A0A3M7SUV1_BRAPC|nr:hypothetical protein BpHYR1_033132 [Brachionus plicatilis]
MQTPLKSIALPIKINSGDGILKFRIKKIRSNTRDAENSKLILKELGHVLNVIILITKILSVLCVIKN